jgi:hypothetical protein
VLLADRAGLDMPAPLEQAELGPLAQLIMPAHRPLAQQPMPAPVLLADRAAPLMPAPLPAVPVLEEPKRAVDAVELGDPRMRQAFAFIDSQDGGVLDKAKKLLQDGEKKKMYLGVGNVKSYSRTARRRRCTLAWAT